MNKPEVKIIQNQEEIVNDSILDNWEVEQLLRKYGYDNNISTEQNYQQNYQNNLTFEELVLQNEAKIKEEEKRKLELKNNRSNFYSTSTNATDEDTGFTFKIEIVSDMKIP